LEDLTPDSEQLFQELLPLFPVLLLGLDEEDDATEEVPCDEPIKKGEGGRKEGKKERS
jgi:hypothetical protein